jgi:tRNA G18 (ribose-2'-O)-methylase SpoU
MKSNKFRKLLRRDRENARRRYRKHKNINLLAKPGLHDCVIVLDHLKPTFNVGKIFRSADAFGIREIHLIGIDFFDPAPARGSFKWVPARFHDVFDTCHSDLLNRGFTIFSLDPEDGNALPKVHLPRRSAFVFGHEEFGVSFKPNEFKNVQTISIPQYGKVQSLNVSIAASIVMYEYIRRHSSHKAIGNLSVSDGD